MNDILNLYRPEKVGKDFNGNNYEIHQLHMTETELSTSLMTETCATITDADFRKIVKLAMEHWGLHVTEKKRQLVSNRMSRFLRRSPFGSTSEYLDFLAGSGNEEDYLAFFDLLSTNVTHFFRERAHFDFLEHEFYTPLARGTLTLPGKRIRIWSAACSNGAEPFSMAIQALQLLPELKSWDFKILASDLSTTMIQEATQAVYPLKMVERVEPELLSRYFLRGKGSQDGLVKVRGEARSLVTLRRMNLMEPWTMRGPFDVIFCRNVMIYFDKPTRSRLVQRMYDILRPGGYFMIGSAETLSGLDSPFSLVQPAVYQK